MKKLVYIALLIFITPLVYGQDIHFSQLDMIPLSLNPANAGAFKGDQRVAAIYSDQWRSASQPYQTYSLVADGMVLKQEGGQLGMGIMLYKDRAGDLKMGSTIAKVSVAYHLIISPKQKITGGLAAGVGQQSINLSNAKFGDQFNGSGYDASMSTNDMINAQNFLYGDFSGGMLWTYRTKSSTLSSKDAVHAAIGVSYFHFNRPKRSLVKSSERMFSKAIVHGTLSYGISNTNLELQPSAYYFLQGKAMEAQGGINVRYVLKEESKFTGLVKGAAVGVGGYLRWKDAFVLTTTLEYANYAIGFSYDINTSKLRTASNGKGAFEISLRFTNPNPFLYKGTSGSVRFL